MKILIVGAGLYGCTAAYLLRRANHDVTIAEAEDHVGGMCYTHDQYGIEVHDFGPHIFHTSDDFAWSLVNNVTSFTQYEHHVIAKHGNDMYFMPFNLSMMKQFFGKKYGKPLDIDSIRLAIFNEIKNSRITTPQNLEEQAISLVGTSLYEAFIKNYTKKQWNKDPKELDASIIKRIPVRYDYNISYYNDQHVGIPKCGYTRMLESLAYGAKTLLSRKMGFSDIRQALLWFDKVIYTGPIDELFSYNFGRLEWRSLKFDTQTYMQKSYQGCPCINYVDADVPYTRVHEYKYYRQDKSAAFDQNITVVQQETPQDWDIDKPRYYPICNEQTDELYKRYKTVADSINGLLVGGRLGKYKYYDMDDTIIAAKNDLMSWHLINGYTNDERTEDE